MSKNFPVPDFQSIAKKIIENRKRFAEIHALKFFKESFYKQGFKDDAFVPWESRNSPDYRQGGAILTMTGHLKDSLSVLNSNENEITFGTYVPYAKIHNEGGTVTVPVTPKMKKYFWYMYISTKQDKWKFMALTKKPFMKFKVPKRQFIGESKTLMSELEAETIRMIQAEFQNLKTK